MADALAALTEREQEIVQRLAQGLIYKEIADQLGINIGTVRAHICRIYEKLHARSRHEAVLKAPSRLPPAGPSSREALTEKPAEPSGSDKGMGTSESP